MPQIALAFRLAFFIERPLQIATANAQKMNAVGESIKKAAMSIQELETQLASQSI